VRIAGSLQIQIIHFFTSSKYFADILNGATGSATAGGV
jgi:hypothetical protein